MSSVALSRIGSPIDIYYQDAASARIQSIPVEYNTRYNQAFNNPGTGTSVFTIPPGNGCKHVLVTLGYNDLSSQTGTRSLSRGWGYNAIQQVSFRIGGSSQYFLTGQQLLARNIRMCRTQSQADSLINLGGEALSLNADFTNGGHYAYVPISVWSPPSEDELSVPLPGDALGQQIQITVTLNPTSAFWSAPITITGVSDVAPPTSFDTANFTVEQLVMLDRSMAMANRVNLETHSYGMPISFDQQEVTIGAPTLGATASPQSVVLTGFRAGSCRQLQVYLTLDSDTLLGRNLNQFYVPKEVTVLYGGVIYAQYLNGSSQMWNLLDGTKPAAVDNTVVAQPVAAAPFVSASELSNYVLLPFGQPTGSDYAQDLLTHGKEITNGIVNLQVTMPDAQQYTMHVIYNYAATLSFSRGSAELIF
jgi:hypothetical protein